MVQGDTGRTASNTSLRYPTYLYRKVNIYYFRYALPKHQKDALGGTEIQLSLRTPYLREAKLKASQLHTGITALLQEKPMLSLQEIKDKLTILLLEGIDIQTKKLESIKNSEVNKEVFATFGIEEHEHFDAEYVLEGARKLFTDKKHQKMTFDLYKGRKVYGPESDKLTEEEKSDIISMPFSTEAFLTFHAENYAKHLTRPGVFSEKDFLENKPVIAKLFMQFTILFYEYVAKEEAGDLSGAQTLLYNFLATMGKSAQPVPPSQQVERTHQILSLTDALEHIWPRPDVKKK